MSRYQRIKSIITGFVMVLFALALFFIPEISYEIVAGIIGLLMLIYGFRLLWYYFSMARHMVGGKFILFQAIIILDFAVFTGSVASLDGFVIIFYLLGVFAFSGLIDILRAFESKRIGAPMWKLRLSGGCINVLFAVLMLMLGLVFNNKSILVYGFCISLFYMGILRIVTSFRKTAIVYIQ